MLHKKCGHSMIRPESAQEVGKHFPEMVNLTEMKRIRKKRAFQAERTASTNLLRQGTIWNVWEMTSRLV